MSEIKLESQIQVARCLGNYQSNTVEWHMLRKSGVGGSLVGTIAGLNKWESAVTAFYKYTGQIDDTVPDSPAMEWGRRLESVVLDKFADEHPEMKVLNSVGTWQNNERTFQIANPDAIAVEPDGSLSVIEIKTAKYPDDWTDGVPLYYLTQVQWYMSTLGLSKAYVAVLIGGSDYREYEVPADPFQQQADIELVQRFLAAVKENKAPDWDGSKSTHETVRQLHPEIQDVEVELGELGRELLRAQTNLSQVETHATKLKSEVLAMMGNAKHGLVDGQRMFSRQARGTGKPFLVTKK